MSEPSNEPTTWYKLNGCSLFHTEDIIWGTEGVTPEKLAEIKISNLPEGATNPKIHLRRKMEGCASYELNGFVYTHVISCMHEGLYRLSNIITSIDSI
jgi:hypothetical protein